jgi:hypothetical protein
VCRFTCGGIHRNQRKAAGIPPHFRVAFHSCQHSNSISKVFHSLGALPAGCTPPASRDSCDALQVLPSPLFPARSTNLKSELSCNLHQQRQQRHRRTGGHRRRGSPCCASSLPPSPATLHALVSTMAPCHVAVLLQQPLRGLAYSGVLLSSMAAFGSLPSYAAAFEVLEYSALSRVEHFHQHSKGRNHVRSSFMNGFTHWVWIKVQQRAR